METPQPTKGLKPNQLLAPTGLCQLFVVTKETPGDTVVQVCECFGELLPAAGCSLSDQTPATCLSVTFATTMLILLSTNHNKPLAADPSLEEPAGQRYIP